MSMNTQNNKKERTQTGWGTKEKNKGK